MTYASKQGNYGLGKAIGYYTSQGCTVSIPLNDTQGYDLVIDTGFKLYRIQVKTTTYKKHNNYYVNLSSSRSDNKDFDNTTCDLIFILTKDENMYEIPSNCIKCTQQMALSDKYDMFKVNYLKFETFIEND